MFIWIKDTFVPSRLHFKNNVMKRYCQTLDLKEDEQLIKEYCYWHSPETYLAGRYRKESVR